MKVIKKLLPNLKTVEFKLVLLVLLLALFVRLYNFENRLTFGPEQAMSLINAGLNITDKFSLQGQELWRVTSQGHILFTSPLFGYTLVPKLLVFNFDPVPITVWFVILNVLTGLSIFWIAKKIFNNFWIGFWGMTLFLFHDLMIYHSMFIWIVNYMPLVSLFIFYNLWLFYKKREKKYVFLVGVLGGINFGLDYSFFFSGLLVFVLIIILSKNKIKDGLIFILGGMLGELPTIIFDLKHQFYHLNTMWMYLVDTLKNPDQAAVAYYHHLHWYGILFLILGGVLYLVFRVNKYLGLLCLTVYLFLNLTSDQISFTRSIGMLPGMSVEIWKQAAKVIAEDNPPEKFEVTTLLDFNSRAYPLRYFVKFNHGLTPMGVEEYKNPEANYVFAAKNYDFDKALAWEIWVYQPFKVEILKDLGPYSIYKLTKEI